MSDRLVVIGNPESVFVQAPVRFWRGLGIDAVILTARWPTTTVQDLPVLSAERLAPASARSAADLVVPLLELLDRTIGTYESGRAARALRTWGPGAQLPSLAPPARDALLIAAAIETIAPAAVLAHEAFAYGTAVRLAPAPRKALFVWGADVLHYAETSEAAFMMVRDALHGVQYVMVGAESIGAVLHERFGLPLERIALVHYGVDRRHYHRAGPEEGARIRAAYGIPPRARVVMNLRRFLPHWGAAAVTCAGLALLERNPGVHLVLLEGSDQSDALEEALSAFASRGLRHRVCIVRGHATETQVAELMSVSEVAWSLVESLEPCSWSVLQAAASGSRLVITDQDTYRAECARGLRAALVAGGDRGAVVDATLALLDGRTGAESQSESDALANARFIAAHYDQEQAMRRLLRIVAGEAAARRLLDRSAPPDLVRARA